MKEKVKIYIDLNPRQYKHLKLVSQKLNKTIEEFCEEILIPDLLKESGPIPTETDFKAPE